MNKLFRLLILKLSVIDEEKGTTSRTYSIILKYNIQTISLVCRNISVCTPKSALTLYFFTYFQPIRRCKYITNVINIVKYYIHCLELLCSIICYSTHKNPLTLYCICANFQDIKHRCMFITNDISYLKYCIHCLVVLCFSHLLLYT